MQTEYFKRLMDVLWQGLEQGELVLAEGRAFERRQDSFDLTQVVSGPGCAVVVTERRALWVSNDDQRWVRSLPFTIVSSYAEITRAHRYALAMNHQSIGRLLWVPAHRFLTWSWGDVEAVRPVARSVLAFSRRDTAAARALRMQLQESGVSVGEPLSLGTRSTRWTAS